MSSDSWSVIIPVKPKTKGRPRMTRSGRAYTPKETKEYEAELAAQYVGPLYDGPVHIDVTYCKELQILSIVPIEFHNKAKLRGDLDNYLKATLDGLNGVAWVDDKQVKSISARKT